MIFTSLLMKGASRQVHVWLMSWRLYGGETGAHEIGRFRKFSKWPIGYSTQISNVILPGVIYLHNHGD